MVGNLFKCGNLSEESDIILNFKNSNEISIAKIKFEYIHRGFDSLTNWVVVMYYWTTDTGWNKLSSDYEYGYLFNDWYKLRIQRNGLNYVDYTLNRSGVGLVDFKTANKLGAQFQDLEIIEWSSSKNPIVCPMYFWDDHKIGIIS